MTVRTLIGALQDYVKNYLDEQIPEDYDAVLDVASVVQPDIHENDDDGLAIHGFVPAIKVNLWVHTNNEDQPAAVAVQSTVHLYLVQDLDFEPLDEVLDSMWERAQFALLAYEAKEEMDRALEDHTTED